MSSVLKPLLTPQEYLARERKAEFRSEYYRGEMFAMAGTSWEHTLIKENIARHAGNQLRSCFKTPFNAEGVAGDVNKCRRRPVRERRGNVFRFFRNTV
jgi:hypothetical protein